MSGFNVRAGKKGGSIFDYKYLVLLERMFFELYQSQHRERDVNESSLFVAMGVWRVRNKGSGQKQVYNLVRLWPYTGNTKIKQKTYPTTPGIGLKSIVPVLAG